MKTRFFLPGAAILLLLASSCKQENIDPLNRSEYHDPADSLSSPTFHKTFGGSMSDFGISATKSTDGGYVIAGGTNSTDGDISANHGSYDGWLVKIDRYGNKLWQKTYGGTGYDQFHAIASTSDGGFIMAGQTESHDGDVSGYHGGHVPDVWVVKTDASGNITWSKAIGNSQREGANSIIESSDGNYIIVGKRDVAGYAVKLDKSGNILWEKILHEGSFFNEFTSVFEDLDGNYIAMGFANHKGDSNDFWLVKLNKNGDVLMHKLYGGQASEQAFAATMDQDGAYILAGIRQIVDENMSDDVMLIKVNQEGTCLWERVLKAPDNESAASIVALDKGGYLVAENTSLPDLTSSGAWLQVDKDGNKLEKQKVADHAVLAFMIKGGDNNIIMGGWEIGENGNNNMLVIGLPTP
jgi:hypothetical protein